MSEHPLPLHNALRAILLKRLLIPFVAASFLVTGMAAAYGGKLVEDQQLRYSQSVGYAVTEFLEHAVNDLNSFNAVLPNSSLTALQKNMAASQITHNVFDTIYLLNSDKTVKTLAPFDIRYEGMDMSRQKFFEQLDCSAGVNFSVPFTSSRTGQPTAYLTRCADGGGYLVGELNLHSLQDTIEQGLARETVFIVDSTGTLLAHRNFQMVEQHINIGDSTIFQKALMQDSSAAYWKDGNMWVGSASMEPTARWIVITEVPLLTVYAPYIFLIGILTLTSTLIFSLAVRDFLSQLKRKLITPLVYLSINVDALAKGNYTPTETSEETIPFTEIASLLNNFRNMRHAIYARESELRESERQYRRLVEDSPDAIILHNDSFIVYANESALKLYGATSPSDIVGKPILERIHPSSHWMKKARLQKMLQTEEALPMAEQKHIRLDNKPFDVEVLTSAIFFAGSYVAQTIVRDITKRKSEEELLKYRATHDPLTELPNRFLFQDRLQRALARAEQDETIGAVLYLDLDNFKSINDAYGHRVGDQTLQRVAATLYHTMREGDTLARLSGDEFVILLENLNDPLEAETSANQMIDTLSQPYIIESHEILLSSSVGITIFPCDVADADALLQSADAAMYHAKQEGKHRTKFYAPHMRQQSLERIALQKSLTHALAEKQLFLQYQPQVNYSSGEIIGVEALLRWHHPEMGLISPAKFIPIAEETGLILPIGEWVLQTAWAQAIQWQKIKQHPMRVGVNLSNVQFKQPNIVQTIQRIIAQLEIAPELLELELNENIIFRDADTSFSNLYSLRETGIALAMDDFGAGFSTLGYLAHIPFDRIKIDQRLVANIENPKDAAVVSGVIAICNNLNLEVLAEGVETEQQLNFCAEKGCNFFQGYHYSRPVGAAEITNYLQHGVPWRK